MKAARLGGAAGASAVAVGILAFYAARLFMPLPIFAADEAAYLIHGLYAPELVARNPYVATINTGASLSLVRIAYRLGGDYIVWDRLADSAVYLSGLLALWGFSARGFGAWERWALLLIAIGFPYYRFAFSNLPEGLYVGVVALMGVATAQLYQRRPMVHAVTIGALAALLVLIKPHGVAMVAAMAVVAVLESQFSRRPGQLAVRIGLFAATFLVLGNLIQHGAHEPVENPLTFFVGGFYGQRVGADLALRAVWYGGLTLGSMAAALALLAGAPLVIGLGDLLGRWRRAGGGLQLTGDDLAFLLFVLGATATLPMVAIFMSKIANDASETARLGGRYFEFFAPLIWLTAGPALARFDARRNRTTGLAAAGVVAAGLAGLLVSLRAGVVLLPWDSASLTAFFAADPVRAALTEPLPFRGLAVLATLLAAAALVMGARPAWIGAGHILALGVLSTALDAQWIGPMVAERTALNQDIAAIRPRLPPEAGSVLLLATDANDGHLAFLQLQARPRVILGPPAQAPLQALAGISAVVTSSPATPPGSGWRQSYSGSVLSLYERASQP